MPQKTITFEESTVRARSKTINIPDLHAVTSVSVDTGAVTHSVSGKDVTANVSNGSSTRSESSSYTPSTTKSDSRATSAGGDPAALPATVPYNDGTYSGTLSKDGAAYVSGGSYVASDSYTAYDTRTSTATNMPTSIPFNSGGYVGTLSAYIVNQVISGSAAGSTTKEEVRTYVCSAVYRWSATSKTWSRVSTDISNIPSSVTYNDGTYSGSIPKVGHTVLENPPSYNGNYDAYEVSRAVNVNARFNGSVSKPDDRVYQNSYSGTVTKPASDSRVWTQPYSGTVYGAPQTTYTYYYGYTVTVNYIDLPTIALKVNGLDRVDGGSLLVADKNAVDLIVTPNDFDTGSTLTYEILLRGSQKVSGSATKGQPISYSVPFSDLVIGSNLITIKVRDNNGAESVMNFTIRNKVPDKISLNAIKEVGLSLGYPLSGGGSLNQIKPNGYAGKLSLAEILNSYT